MFDNWKARCSKLGAVAAENRDNAKLTEIQIKELSDLENKEKLTDKQKDRLAELKLKDEKSKIWYPSQGYMDYLMEEYAFITAKKVRVDSDFYGLQMEKGVLVEAESLQLLSFVEDKFYRPNINDENEQDTIENEFFKGRPDAYVGKSLMEATEIPDIKSAWDYIVYLCKLHTKVSKDNELQLKGYMDISGAKISFVADCLIDTPQKVKDKKKWQLLRQLEGEIATEESPLFKEQWGILERSMTFNDIPAQQRVNKKYVQPFTEYEKNFMYDQVKRGRDFLNIFHDQRIKLNG